MMSSETLAADAAPGEPETGDTLQTVSREIELGTDADRARIVARVELRPLSANTSAETVQTVTHETVRPGQVPTVSVTFERWPAGHREGLRGNRGEPDSLGASREPFRTVVAFADGWTADACEILADAGDRWHLNGMRAGCSHQVVVWEDGEYGRRPSLTETVPCRTSGYRYGHAWLVEPMPADGVGYFRVLVETGRPPVWTVTRDGGQVAGPFPDVGAAWVWILRNQGQSVDYATTHGGYAIVAGAS